MKRWTVIFTIILIATNFEALGAETESVGFWNENFTLTVGMKLWQVNWKSTQKNGDPIEASGQMFGPAASLAFKEKFFTGMTYYRGDNLEYKTEYTDVENEKSDADFWVGYRFTQSMALFAGYKLGTFEQKTELPYQGFSIDYTYTWRIKGPVAGLMGHYPIENSGWVLSAILSLAYLEEERKLKKELFNGNYDLEISTIDKWGPAFSVGLSYNFHRLSGLSLSAGYKLQYHQNTEDSSNDETFSGVSLGVNYLF